MGTTSILGWQCRQPNCPSPNQSTRPSSPSLSLSPSARSYWPLPHALEAPEAAPPWATGALQGGQPAVCSRGLSEPPVRLQQLPT